MHYNFEVNFLMSCRWENQMSVLVEKKEYSIHHTEWWFHLEENGGRTTLEMSCHLVVRCFWCWQDTHCSSDEDRFCCQKTQNPVLSSVYSWSQDDWPSYESSSLYRMWWKLPSKRLAAVLLECGCWRKSKYKQTTTLASSGKC